MLDTQELLKLVDDLRCVLDRISLRCPTDSGAYVMASVGDSARNAIDRIDAVLREEPPK